MISWSAYAPRRARDPQAWLRAKGIETRESLHAVLLELGIDPKTFPKDLADGLCQQQETQEVPAPCETMPEEAQVEQPAPNPLQAEPRKQKRLGRTPT